MPHTLIETATFHSTLTVPDDGDGVIGASVSGPVGKLADRTQLLHKEAVQDGVRRIRIRPDYASVKALTGMMNEEVRLLPGAGLYTYVAASSRAEAIPWCIAPDSGVGRWWHENADLVGAGSGVGFATVTGAGKVVQPVPNRIVSQGELVFAQTGDSIGQVVAVSTTSTSYVDVSPLAVDVAVFAGDKITVRAGGLIGNGSLSSSNAFAKLVKVDGGVESDVLGCWQVGPAGTTLFSWAARVTATNTGTLTIKVKLRSESGAPCWIEKPSFILWELVRP